MKRTAVTAGEGTVFGLFGPLRFLRLLLVALLLAWLVATVVLFVWPATDSPRRADAVVVLSGGRNWRLDPALRLMRENTAPVLVISAADLDAGWRKAQELCAHGATGFRILCVDPHPYSTRGEARMIARLARTHGWRTIDVVTSRYHVFRARMLIERCYHGRLAVVGAHYPWVNAPLDWVSEWGKLLVQVTAERSC